MSSTSELNKLLPSLLSQLLANNKKSTIEYTIKKLIILFKLKRENIDDIISKTAEFFNKNIKNISNSVLFKVITRTIAKLEENNYSLAHFINKNLPLLMSMIYASNKSKEEIDELTPIIGELLKRCGSNACQIIDKHVNTILIKLKQLTSNTSKNSLDGNNKYALITSLTIIIQNAPVICYNKIIKSFDEDFGQILPNFEDPRIFIRKATQELIEEFLVKLSYKDLDTRKKYAQKIYNKCIEEYINKPYNEKTLHGMILVAKSLTVRREFFNEKYVEILKFFQEKLNVDSPLIRSSIIEVIPDFYEYLPHVFEEKFFDIFITYFIKNYDNQIKEEIKTAILISIGRLSLIPSKNNFSKYSQRIIGMLRNDIEKSPQINIKILDCFSDLMESYSLEFGGILPFTIYCKKIFTRGFSESHITFIQKLLKFYPKNSKENVQIIMSILNVISYIITDGEFNFKNTIKKLMVLSGNYGINKPELNPIENDNNLIPCATVKIGSSQLEKNDIASQLLRKFTSSERDYDFDIFVEVGKTISSFLENFKKEPNYPTEREKLIIFSLTILSFIDDKIFQKDIFIFYKERCIHLLNTENKKLKEKVIELANAPWIPEIYLTPKPEQLQQEMVNYICKKNISPILHSKIITDIDVEFDLNFILECYLNSILIEPDDELKLVMLKKIDDKRFYHFISKTNFFIKLVSLFEVDNTLIKEKAVEIVGKIIIFNFNTIRTYIKKKILQIFTSLEISTNQYKKEENIILLSFFVKYTANYIIDDIEIIFSTLLEILKDETPLENENPELNKTSDLMIIGILSIVSELMGNKYYNKKQIEPYLKEIMLISINLLKSNSTSFAKEETALYTILSILINSTKEWKIYIEYLDLVSLIIQVLTKSQNKKSRLYSLKILGFIGTMNPEKLRKKIDLRKIQKENLMNEYYINEESNEENNEIIQQKKEKKVNKGNKSKVNLNNGIIRIDLNKHINFDFEKAMHDKTLNSSTYYAILTLLKIATKNSNHDISHRIIKILKELLEMFTESDYPVIYIILPSLINLLDNFEGNSLQLVLETIKYIVYNYKNYCLHFRKELLLIAEKYLKDKDTQDIAIDILIKLFEYYKNEISEFLPKIIPLLINKLADKEDKENIIKKKVLTCLNILDKKISNYLSLIVPELVYCLDLSINKNKLIPYINNDNYKTSSKSIKISKSSYDSNDLSSFPITDRKSLVFKKNSYDINDNTFDKDLFSLLNNLLSFDGIANHMDYMVKILLAYLEEIPSSGKLIMNIFIKMLNNFHDEFLVFFPLIIQTSKEVGIPCLQYFTDFRCGLEKNKIIYSISYNSKEKRIFHILPIAGKYERNTLKNSFGSKRKSNIYSDKQNLISDTIAKNTSTNNTSNRQAIGDLKNNSNNSNSNEEDEKEITSPKIQKLKGLDRQDKIDKSKVLNEFYQYNCSSEDEWHEWFQNSSKNLFDQSPSHILFSCQYLSSYDSQIYNYLYNSAFYSLWKILSNEEKQKMLICLNNILKKPKVPNDILLTIINLNEFINKEENYYFEFLKFGILGKAAYNCKAYAKALYYIENEYINNNELDSLGQLITLYNDLGMPDAAMGVLALTKSRSKKDSNRLEKEYKSHLRLYQWEEALNLNNKLRNNNPNFDLEDEKDKEFLEQKALCLNGLSDWENLINLGEEICNENNKDEAINAKLAPLLSEAAFNLGKWEKLKKYSENINISDDDYIYEKNFFKAILDIKTKNYDLAQEKIDIARSFLDEKIKTLLSESYERAYKLLLANESLCELEEVIKFFKLTDKDNEISEENKIIVKENLKIQWDKRLKYKDEDIKTYERIIGIRSLIFSIEEDYLTSLKLSKICRKKDKFSTCNLVLNRLQIKSKNCEPDVNINVGLALSKCTHDNKNIKDNLDNAISKLKEILDDENFQKVNDKIKSKIYCYYAIWNEEEMGEKLKQEKVNGILSNLELSTKFNDKNYKAWHSYAMINYKFFEYDNNTQISYAINAIKGFTKSVIIGGKNLSKTLQDLLRLIDIWFQVGQNESINELMCESFNSISLESWLVVIPQLLARIGVSKFLVRKTLVDLLKKIGITYPRSLDYPLIVLKQSKSQIRAEEAAAILSEMEKNHSKLLEECELVVNELNRCALCLHEQWSETIEESAKLYFQEKNIMASAKVLSNTHQKTNKKPLTMDEIHFNQLFGGELSEAYSYLQDYLLNNNFISFKQAWDIYYTCFRSMNSRFSNIKYLKLKSVSPSLYNFSQSEIEIPGINKTGEAIVKIASFSRQLTVFNSKQHPRRIKIYGSDNKEYAFLLKGHEDLRQDERVMQLFNLVNTLLSNDSETKKQNLSIRSFPVIPLSHNTGIIGWVPNCDTLFQLIREHRVINKVVPTIEHKLMLSYHYKFDSSIRMTKLEVFKHALEFTLGTDLQQVLFNKSQNAEAWLNRRTNYSRSLAVMSMVGYILGLGDRHPSNIMIDRTSGKIVHIDFGDCFEVAMKREKFPEKVPFRLTRMLINALEIGGVKGNYSKTCEKVMRILRENKDSLIVMLAAFIHDPLISFRLLIPSIVKKNKKIFEDKKKINNGSPNEEDKNNEIDHNLNIINEQKKMEKAMMESSSNKGDVEDLAKKQMRSLERQIYNELEEKDEMESNDLNQIAKIVLERIMDKLMGKDFNKNIELKIEEQVQKLINQATSHENLSQSYIGWCPYW